MKCLCITGADQRDVEIVARVLRQAGMDAPQPARRDPAVDIAFWHDSVIAAAGEAAKETVHPIASPGRLWDQLATDIFVANIGSKVWGWSDTRSIRLLDYWMNFAPGLNFILVCTAPEHTLARLMATDSETVPLDVLIGEWQTGHRQMLRFYRGNPQHCLLVDARDCAANPAAFIECCRTRWNLPLAEATDIDAAQPLNDSLAIHMAQQLVRDYPHAVALQLELDATITRLGGAEHGSDQRVRPEGPYGISRGALSFRRLISMAGRVCAELRAQFDEAVASHAPEQNNIEMRLNASTRENEILLSRLYQVQEELEACVGQSESRKRQIEDLSTAKSKLDQEVSALAARGHELQKEVQSLTRARDEQAKLATDRQAQIVQLTKQRDEQAALATRNDAERKGRTEALEAAQAKLKEAEQENELLLLQLHQVQEELEHYFLKHQDAEKEVTAARARWDRMLQRNPEYCDYESIEVVTMDEAAPHQPSPPSQGGVAAKQTGWSITWRITNLNAGGRTFSELQFKTVVERGIAGFVLTREPGTTGPLIRWPARAADRNELALVPAGDRSRLAEQIEILLDLATADWDFLKALVGVVSEALDSPATVKLSESRTKSLREGFAKLDKIIYRFSSALRYDRVTLKREQVNPDYEHLWLRFENFSMGSKRWPQFEFRLSCANVGPKRFGHHPKLEFPEETGQAPFENWFAESHDDFGAKLELRFALPESMDLAVWQRLSANDHVFLKALIARLPATLAMLEADGVKLSRPWKAWTAMVDAVQRVLALRTGAPSASIPANATPVAISDVAAPSRERPAKPKATSGNGRAIPKANSGDGHGKKPLLKASRATKATKTNGAPQGVERE